MTSLAAITYFDRRDRTDGVRVPCAWSDLRDSLTTAPQSRATPKDDVPLWSPAIFKDDKRHGDNVISVGALVLDDDQEPATVARRCKQLAGMSAIVHSSSGHTPRTPRNRIVLELSRAVTADEHARLWRVVAAWLPFPVGQEAKDAARAWHVPHEPTAGEFIAACISGAPIDVDALLAEAPPPSPQPVTIATRTDTPSNAKRAAARLLADAWPAKGRHVAQLALGGALVRGGYSENDAIEFLCDVCRLAGDENRTKRTQTIQAAINCATNGKPFTGFGELSRILGAPIVNAARALLGLKDEAPEWFTEKFKSAAPLTSAPAVVTPDLFSYGGWDAAPEPIEYTIGGVLTRGSVNMLVAHGGSLKTWAALSMMVAVSSGRDWLDKFQVTQGRAALLDFESGRSEIRRRIHLLGAQGAGDQLGWVWSADHGHSLMDQALWERIEKNPPALLVIDSLSAGCPGVDENDTAAARPLLLAKRLAEGTGCAVVFIHHANKGAKSDAREGVRGSSALFAACDGVFRFTAPEEIGKDRITRMICIKARRGETPEPIDMRLSNAKGLTREDCPTSSGGTSAEEIKAAILLQIGTRGHVTGKKELARLVQRRFAVVAPLVDELKEAGDIAYVDRRFVMNGEAERERRVLAVLEQWERRGEELRTAGDLARLARVSVDDVRRLDGDSIAIGRTAVTRLSA